jgi:hypothetical protein
LRRLTQTLDADSRAMPCYDLFRSEKGDREMKILGWLALFALVLPTYALAQQGYTIQTPGQLPAYVNPNGGGGYTVQTPGQLPTYVNPNGGGGYTVQTPGQLPTYVQPNAPARPCVGFNCR